jgi:hypothetical protein
MTWRARLGRVRPVRGVVLAGDVVRSFYQRPVAWFALVVSAAFLTYGGGAVMFWLHAVVRGEAGPAIDNVHHWLLDSTLGFIALTPLLAVIVPLAAWRARGEGRSADSGYILVAATVFTAFTGPGPLLHNMVAGAGTPLANLATRIFGADAAAAARSMHAPSHSAWSEGLLQLFVGFPVYLACTWLALRFVRGCVRVTRPRPRASTSAGSNDAGSAEIPVSAPGPSDS